MSFELILAPTTSATTTVARSFVETEQIIVVAAGLATTETVTVNIFCGTTNTSIALFGAAAANFGYVLTATSQALVVPGGYLMTFTKQATAAPVGIEIHYKPRVARA